MDQLLFRRLIYSTPAAVDAAGAINNAIAWRSRQNVCFRPQVGAY